MCGKVAGQGISHLDLELPDKEYAFDPGNSEILGRREGDFDFEITGRDKEISEPGSRDERCRQGNLKA